MGTECPGSTGQEATDSVQKYGGILSLSRQGDSEVGPLETDASLSGRKGPWAEIVVMMEVSTRGTLDGVSVSGAGQSSPTLITRKL